MKVQMHKNDQTQSDYAGGCVEITAETASEHFELGQVFQQLVETEARTVKWNNNGRVSIRVPITRS